VGDEYRAPSGTSIGHVHLKVADLDRAIAFYRDVLGLELIQRLPDNSAAFLSAGGYHHHVALNTWLSRGATPPAARHTGLYHFAIRYPTRRDLGAALKRVIDAGVELHGGADHGVSESIYLLDPDGNGIELTRDRPPEEWPRRPDGTIHMTMADPLDMESLLDGAARD
jgi:catechol 2,3-dioxygenase